MSAEIIQFVPKANPNRDIPLDNAKDQKPMYGGIVGCGFWKCEYDTAPSEWCQPGTADENGVPVASEDDGDVA